jgi:hypothetical protein
MPLPQNVFDENSRRYMSIKISPMQDLPIYCYQSGHLENVQKLMCIVLPSKVLPDSFFWTYTFNLQNNFMLYLGQCTEISINYYNRKTHYIITGIRINKKGTMERCPRGRRGTTGNRVWS